MYSEKVIELLKALNVKNLDGHNCCVYGYTCLEENKFLVINIDSTSKGFWDVKFKFDKELYNKSEDYYCVDCIWFTYDKEYKIYTFLYDTISYDESDQNKIIGTISEEDLIKNGIEITV